ncbi:Gfo/Idh/MocA family protein [Natronobiforma cellulositropha]|uniref:Gfo/Idh/MocA family protein n=1 Tax=Natronobiforma cellulositropha TaxID=1679076 RepID=UPI0021D5942E|nr:Gfo/Idh/MocA family oxidoreductase [Natronobiforma cellulositropha]
MTDADTAGGTAAETSIAIIGIGAVAEVHALAIDDVAGATLVAGSCRTEETGRAFAERFDCAWYDDTATMLAETAPDVVTVCTPSGAHLEAVTVAAEYGADVLCEKPLEITTERIDRLVEVATEAEITLGGIFQQRFNPVVRTVREASEAGRFGSLAVANATVPWWRDDAYYGPERWQGTQALDGGGALMNQSIHGIDAIQWLAAGTMDLEPGENPVAAVSAYTAVRGHDDDLLEVEDTAVAALRFRNGALGQLLGTTAAYPGSERRLVLGGRDGTATVEGDELVTWRFREEDAADERVRERFGETGAGSGGATDPMDIEYANHARTLEAFLEARRSDEPYPLDAAEARKAVEIIEAIYESADRGEPVTIE